MKKCYVCTAIHVVALQYGAKAGTAFGKLMFASEPGSAAADLASALRWAEGEASPEGPYFLGKNFTLVSSTADSCWHHRRYMS